MSHEGSENPFTSIGDTIAFDVRDWSEEGGLAWIYGIACGWDVERLNEEDSGAMAEVQAKFKWSNDTVERLRRLRVLFRAAEANAYSAPEVGHCMFCLGQMDGEPCLSYDGRPHELCGCGNTEGDLPILVIGAEPCFKAKPAR